MDRWAPKHDYQKIDLAFIVDCTGSMGSYIRQAQKHVNTIAETISRTVYNVKLALIEYRDHPPQDKSFVTRVHDFTEEVKEMKRWVDGMSAEGGGDWPESVADALMDATRLSFREDATKMCVLIADAPPHGLDQQIDEFPNGCPSGYDPLAACHLLAQKGIVLYTIGCEPSVDTFRDFLIGLAHITGGQYVPLHSASTMSKVIINGALEEVSLEKLIGYTKDFIQLELMRGKAEKKVVTVDQLSEDLEKRLRLTNSTCKQLQVKDAALAPVTEDGRKYSNMQNITEARALYEKRKKSHERNMSAYRMEITGEVIILDGLYTTKNQCERLVMKVARREKIPVTHDEENNEIIIGEIPMEP